MATTALPRCTVKSFQVYDVLLNTSHKLTDRVQSQERICPQLHSAKSVCRFKESVWTSEKHLLNLTPDMIMITVVLKIIVCTNLYTIEKSSFSENIF